jgi:hypothetical protein
VTDRDAAYAELVEGKGKSYWWSDEDFANYLSVIKSVTEVVSKPMILWQIPIGNKDGTNQTDSWQDQKVELLFDNIDELANVHVVALQFGGGVARKAESRCRKSFDDGAERGVASRQQPVAPETDRPP